VQLVASLSAVERRPEILYLNKSLPFFLKTSSKFADADATVCRSDRESPLIGRGVVGSSSNPLCFYLGRRYGTTSFCRNLAIVQRKNFFRLKLARVRHDFNFLRQHSETVSNNHPSAADVVGAILPSLYSTIWKRMLPHLIVRLLQFVVDLQVLDVHAGVVRERLEKRVQDEYQQFQAEGL
jgi:hypothetical protein